MVTLIDVPRADPPKNLSTLLTAHDTCCPAKQADLLLYALTDEELEWHARHLSDEKLRRVERREPY